MRLSCDRTLLSQLELPDIGAAILERRAVIQHHHDIRGDDRCWFDDYVVWKMLDDSPPAPCTLPSFEDAMALCQLFYQHRHSDTPDPVSPDAILDDNKWDDDLSLMTENQFLDELVRIQETIRHHRDITDRPRTIEDDRMLYAILPEKIPADFRLGSEQEFLGETKAPHAGCPAFWRSHANCPAMRHNFHQWGPCE